MQRAPKGTRAEQGSVGCMYDACNVLEQGRQSAALPKRRRSCCATDGNVTDGEVSGTHTDLASGPEIQSQCTKSCFVAGHGPWLECE